jgi:hypothetical protein
MRARPFWEQLQSGQRETNSGALGKKLAEYPGAVLSRHPSGRYHLEKLEAPVFPRKFIVSCSGDTQGYLPHPSQIPFGCYEVDGLRAFMGLGERVELKVGNSW